MRTELIIIALLFIHWVADFVFKPDEMAQRKSKEWKYLIEHTSCYTAIFTLGMAFLLTIIDFSGDKLNIIPFVSITFIAHTIQDYITSRINTKFWNEKKVHLFFVSIGFDQFLHFVQLILTYKLLFNEF